jgi:hypothetical protein
MKSSSRNMLFFVDKCPAHPTDTTFLENIKVVFLPMNCMSRLQPLDLQVLLCLMAKHKKPPVQRKSEIKLNVMKTMHMIVTS